MRLPFSEPARREGICVVMCSMWAFGRWPPRPLRRRSHPTCRALSSTYCTRRERYATFAGRHARGILRQSPGSVTSGRQQCRGDANAAHGKTAADAPLSTPSRCRSCAARCGPSRARWRRVIERTAMSPFIREKKDFYAALFDAAGRLIVGSNLPVFGDVVGPIAEHYPLETMRPGDIYWFNDCYASQGRRLALARPGVRGAGVRGRQALGLRAVAGRTSTTSAACAPGSLSPDCTDIFQEGIIVPPVRVVREGVVVDELLRLFFRNSRFPEMVKGDTRASMAAIRLGERRLAELFERFGRARTIGAFDRADRRDRARAARRSCARWCPRASTPSPTPSTATARATGPSSCAIAWRSTAERITLDTSASDDQVPGPVNFLMSPPVPAMVFGSYLLGEGSESILNAGVERAIDEVIVRAGLDPAAEVAGAARHARRHHDAQHGGLPRPPQRGDRRPGHGRAQRLRHLVPARARRQGRAVPACPTGSASATARARPPTATTRSTSWRRRTSPPSSSTRSFPCACARYAINPDTGGPGRWRGGCGLVRELEVLAPEAMVSMRIDSVEHPPWGVAGGHAAGTGRCVVNPGPARRARPAAARATATSSSAATSCASRPAAAAAGAIPSTASRSACWPTCAAGFVSRASAEEHYGVVLAADGASRRPGGHAEAPRRAGRTAKLFHRHGYHDVLA